MRKPNILAAFHNKLAEQKYFRWIYPNIYWFQKMSSDRELQETITKINQGMNGQEMNGYSHLI